MQTLRLYVDAAVMVDCKFDFSGNNPDEPAAIRWRIERSQYSIVAFKKTIRYIASKYNVGHYR